MEHLTEPDSGRVITVPVRYWAGAEAAAGCASEHLEVRTAARATGADLRRAVIGAHPGIDGVLRRCSLLQAGHRLGDGDGLMPGEQVEVLPPFVGG